MSGYRLCDEIGAGGAATVYLAERLTDGARVALKVALADTELARRRLEREARALREIGAPYAPAFIEMTESGGGRAVLAMEYMPDSFHALVSAGPEPLPGGRVVEVGVALATAVARIHDAGWVHRDLKPENLFVRASAPLSLAVSDYGLAVRAGDEPSERSGLAGGTPRYAAPELLDGSAGLDGRTDLYAIGVILYRLASGRMPFEGDADAIKYGHLALTPPPPGRFAEVAPGLEELILRCLAKAPEQRPESADALARALDGVDVGEAAAGGSDAAGSAGRAVERELAAVLLCRSGADAVAQTRAVERSGGRLLRQRDDLYWYAFAANAGERPLEVARRSARELAPTCAGTVIDLVELTGRRTASGETLWVSPGLEGMVEGLPQRGSAMTNRAAMVLSRVAGSDGPGVRVTARGLAPLLDAAIDGARECFWERSAGLFLAIGGRGSGKSRVCSALIERIATELPDAEHILLSVDDAGELDVAQIAQARERATSRPIAVVIDNLHRATSTALELLEYAFVGGEAVQFWGIGSADPGLLSFRPQFGERADRRVTMEIPALSEEDGVAMAAELLAPAEYPPASTLRALWRSADGNPGRLVAVCETLHREGFVRRQADGEAYYLATPELSALEQTPLHRWIAERAIAGLSPELAAVAVRCAVLGAPVEPEELAAVQASLAVAGDAQMVDAGVGLRELERHGLLRSSADGMRFRSAELADGLAQRLSGAEREAIHRAAYDYWHRNLAAGPATERLARHAAGAGLTAAAAAAFLDQAERALAELRCADAERLATRCLEQDAGAEVRAIGLCMRAEALAYLHRLSEARSDIRAAAEIAVAQGNDALRARLELVTALADDWAGEYEAAAMAVERAAPLAGADDPVVRARLEAACGRVAWRRGELEEAQKRFEQAIPLARDAGDYHAEIVARILLPLVHVRAGELERARQRFDEVIALCAERGDALHGSGAYANRMFLWSALEEPESGRADLRRAIALARESGNPATERIAAYNLAEDLHWSGDVAEALALAQRSLALQSRFGTTSAAIDNLLVARIHAAAGMSKAAAESLAEVLAMLADEPDPTLDLFVRAVSLQGSGAAREQWEELEAAATGEFAGDEKLELYYLWVLTALAGNRLDEAAEVAARARPLLGEFPIWNSRYSSLPV